MKTKKSNRKTIILFMLLSFVNINTFSQNDSTNVNRENNEIPSFLSTIPYENVNGKIIIKVGINGKFYRFWIDTGAFATSISKKLSKKLNLDSYNKVWVSDQSNKKDSIDIVTLNEFSLGDLTFNNIDALVENESSVLNECFETDGVIGNNLLANFIVQFSSHNKTISITTDRERLNLNEKQSAELILDEQRNPYFSIKLKNNKKEFQQVSLFDTGCSSIFVLSLDDCIALNKCNVLKKIGVAYGSNSFGLNGHANDTTHYRYHIPILEINAIQYHNAQVQTTSGSSSRIGSKILEDAVVTLDYRNKKYYLSPITSNKIDAYTKPLPFDPDLREGKIVIGFIWDYAACKNMHLGDEILSINDYDFQKLNPCDFLTKVVSIKGTKKNIVKTKDKNGIIQTTTFKKKQLK